LPSTSEILPTAYLEAWSLGKPVIAGLAHGVPEFVEGNQAGLCVSHQPGEVAEAIVKLLSAPEIGQQYAAAGKKLVESQYSREAITGALEQLYTELLSPKKNLCDC
jgi:glycosyltransferase involved in cell wall biosynthesis